MEFERSELLEKKREHQFYKLFTTQTQYYLPRKREVIYNAKLFTTHNFLLRIIFYYAILFTTQILPACRAGGSRRCVWDVIVEGRKVIVRTRR